MEGNLRVPAIAVGGRGQDHAPDTALLHGAQDVQTAFAVDEKRVQGIAVAGDLARREMDHHLGPLECLAKRRRVENRALVQVERRVMEERAQILERAAGKIVYSLHGVAALKQSLGQVRADEARDSGNGNPHTTESTE